MARACKNWLDTFLEWTEELSEAPLSMLTWTGLFCISSVVKRKIQFSREHLKQYEIYPTSYIMFVAPPGVATKSTTAGHALKIINTMNDSLAVTDPAYVNVGPTSGSHVKILENMSKTVDASMMVISGEFGNIVSTTPEETYDFFAKMFDSDETAKKIVHSTRGHGNEVLSKPSLNLLGCTTPEWMAGNAGYVLGGGFAARTVFIFEYHKRQRRLFYKGIGPSVEKLGKMRKDLAKDLRTIGNLKGEFVPESDKLADEMEEWYQTIENFKGEIGTETFQQRKHVHVIRTAMLLSLCESDKLVITQEHFHKALDLVAKIEVKLGRGLSVVGRNPNSAMLYDVLDYIQTNEPTTRGKIMSRFWKNFQNPDMELGVILDVLKTTGQIQRVTLGDSETFRINKEKKK